MGAIKSSRSARLTSASLGRCAALAAASVLCSAGAALAQSPVRDNPCAIYGSGYVAVQGTDGCARIGGRVRLGSGAPGGHGGDGFAAPLAAAGLPPGRVADGARRVHLRLQQKPGNAFDAPRTR